jgi:hypothetical protein
MRFTKGRRKAAFFIYPSPPQGGLFLPACHEKTVDRPSTHGDHARAPPRGIHEIKPTLHGQ